MPEGFASGVGGVLKRFGDFNLSQKGEGGNPLAIETAQGIE
jgi:hypothetical protein